jgi:hypothetical protein
MLHGFYARKIFDKKQGIHFENVQTNDCTRKRTSIAW